MKLTEPEYQCIMNALNVVIECHDEMLDMTDLGISRDNLKSLIGFEQFVYDKLYKKYSNKYSLKVRYELMQNPKDNPKFVF